MTKRRISERDTSEVAWMTAVGFVLGLAISLLTPDGPRHTVDYGYMAYYQPQPPRPERPEPPCPKGQRLASITFSRGFIVGGTCTAIEASER
jgi:hypothetical protein